MGAGYPLPDKVLLAIFKRAQITEKEHDHIHALIRNMHNAPRPFWATNPYVIYMAAFHARIAIKEWGRKKNKRTKRTSTVAR